MSSQPLFIRMSPPRCAAAAQTSLVPGGRAIMRGMAAALLCLALVNPATVAMAAEAPAPVKKQTHIPAQSLGSALKALAKERGLRVVFVAEEVERLRTPGVSGEFTSEE